MGAKKSIILSENKKFTGEISKITKKQKIISKKKTFIKHNLVQKLYEIHVKVCKE